LLVHLLKVEVVLGWVGATPVSQVLIGVVNFFYFDVLVSVLKLVFFEKLPPVRGSRGGWLLCLRYQIKRGLSFDMRVLFPSEITTDEGLEFNEPQE